MMITGYIRAEIETIFSTKIEFEIVLSLSQMRPTLGGVAGERSRCGWQRSRLLAGAGHWNHQGKCRVCREERADGSTAGQQADYAIEFQSC
jgi:hypothetical protein